MSLIPKGGILKQKIRGKVKTQYLVEYHIVNILYKKKTENAKTKSIKNLENYKPSSITTELRER